MSGATCFSEKLVEDVITRALLLTFVVREGHKSYSIEKGRVK